MNRNGYSIRTRTKIAQKLPKEFAEKITSFQRYIIRLRLRAEYALDCIGNMDETPVTMDMVGNSTVDKVGKKTILLKTTGHEKCRYTIALACIVDGQKLSTGQPTESIGDASAHTPGHLQGLGAVPGDL